MANNGIRYSAEIKISARNLRRKGTSLDEIVRQFGISNATAWHWLKDIKLSKTSRLRLQKNSDKGRERGRETMKKRREAINKEIYLDAVTLVEMLLLSGTRDLHKIIAAIIFWCEGYKRGLSSGAILINSDPILVKTYLAALRLGFNIDEEKLSVRAHFHEYHDTKKQIKFWSEVTKIPIQKFKKPYLKPHTKTRKRDGYQGCISVRYGDHILAKKLDAIYHSLGLRLGA